MTFDPSGINKHRLTYIALSRIKTKEKLHLLHLLVKSNFQIDKSISIVMEIDKFSQMEIFSTNSKKYSSFTHDHSKHKH
jgi:hypothetical protein